MDEQKVVDLMRKFFAEMQSTLVAEVVKSLSTDVHSVGSIYI